MKKLVMAMLIGASVYTAQAQDFELGLRGGLNASTFRGIENTSLLGGGVVGVTSALKINEQFSLGADIVYSMQGVGLELLGLDFPVGVNYINMPIYAKYYVGDFYGMHLLGGVQPGFLVNATFDGESTFGDVDVKESFKSFDLGIPVGVGFELDNGFSADIRYIHGLLNISNDQEGIHLEDAYNSVIQVGVNYRFQL